MFRAARHRHRRRKRLARLQLSQLVNGHIDGRFVPCLYAEMVNGGGPVYIELTRWQARYLSETLAKAAMRDAAYWGETVRGSVSTLDMIERDQP